MKIKKIVALTAACAVLSSTAGCQIITIDGEGAAETGENGVVGCLVDVNSVSAVKARAESACCVS